MQERVKPNGKALIPFLVFIGFYLISGLVLQSMGVEKAFYQIPSPISVIIGLLCAFILFKGSVDDKVNDFIKGCGDENIIIMCCIYLLSGAFTVISGQMGGIDSVVNLCLSFIPVQFVIAGIFLISVFISTATGTSVGTVVALGPIAVGVANSAGLSMPLMLASLIGGGLAGDNLSIISDTTIAATRSLNVNNKDKFIMNSKIAIPAIIITFIILLFTGKPVNAVPLTIGTYSFIKIIPYLFVLITAVMGLNVFLVLFSGIVMSTIIGMAYGAFNFIEVTNLMFKGFTGVLDIFLLSLFTGGLAYMVKKEGGIEWAIQKMKKNIRETKSAELAFSALTALTDVATANNTISILIVGQVAKEIGPEYKVDPRRSASLLDISACIVQGIIPYGAQILIACGYAMGKVSPIEVIPRLWYLYLLAIFAILSIFVRFADAKNEWDYVNDRPMEVTKINK